MSRDNQRGEDGDAGEKREKGEKKERREERERRAKRRQDETSQQREEEVWRSLGPFWFENFLFIVCINCVLTIVHYGGFQRNFDQLTEISLSHKLLTRWS